MLKSNATAVFGHDHDLHCHYRHDASVVWLNPLSHDMISASITSINIPSAVISATRTLSLCVVSLLLLHTLVWVVHADSGNCRYDSEQCSCRFGDDHQGVCWDAHPTVRGICTKRFCRAGWTCSCFGRTHVCSMRTTQIHRLVDPMLGQGTSIAECRMVTSDLHAGEPQLQLGTVKIHISTRGMRANSCSKVAWWHNGELLGAHGLIEEDPMNVTAELAVRGYHTEVELKPGDLLAFRFRDASYYCFKSLVEFRVSATSISSTHPNVTTVYARDYTADWYLPSTLLTTDNTGVDESEPDWTKFLPARTSLLNNGVPIDPGHDYWRPRNDSDADHRQGDFYFRVQLPDSIEF